MLAPNPASHGWNMKDRIKIYRTGSVVAITRDNSGDGYHAPQRLILNEDEVADLMRDLIALRNLPRSEFPRIRRYG